MNLNKLHVKHSPWKHLTFQDQVELGTFPFTTDQIADICQVSRQTVKRWKDKDCASIAVRRLLWIVGSGFLPDTPDWEGYSIGRDNRLYTSYGFHLSPGEITALYWERQLMAELKRKNKTLQAQINVLEKSLEENRFLFTAANDARIA